MGRFYLVRKNLAVAQPIMETELGLTKSALGLFLTLHGVLYGISKFFHGFVGDRADGRRIHGRGIDRLGGAKCLFWIERKPGERRAFSTCRGAAAGDVLDGQRVVSGNGLSSLRPAA